MKTDIVLLVAGCVAFLLFVLWRVSYGQGPIPDTVIKIKPSRTAVALEFVVERDFADNVTKIHRFILWSNGDVSFPNIPYYAQLVFSCRDCPERPNPCPGDIDGDGVVAVPDLLILQAAWGNCP